MSVTLQLVSLRGGSFDGELGQAPPPPGTLRLGAKSEEGEWSELYMYVLGEAVNHPKYGTLPLMTYMGRNESV